jgi:hypothetical protein
VVVGMVAGELVRAAFALKHDFSDMCVNSNPSTTYLVWPRNIVPDSCF